MPKSPSTFMKRSGILTHVKGEADRYQEGVHHAHDQPIGDTPEGEIAQDAWPPLSPDKKQLEGNSDIPV